MSKILFLQPAYAHYRDKLFSCLAQRYNIHFIYINSDRAYYVKGNPDTNIHFSFINEKFKTEILGVIYYLLKEKPDIIISSVSTSFSSIISFFYGKIFRKKIILWSLEWKKKSYTKITFKNILGNIRYKVSNMIIVKSDALVVGGTAAYHYAISLGKNQDEIFIAFQSSNDIKTQKNNSFKKNHKYTFLYLSRIIPLKGLDLLIQAFSMLENDREDLNLLIAGDGPFKEHCENLSKLLKVKNIKFYGKVDALNTKEIYEKADVFILPSYFLKNVYEAWGLVINEAMSMELPIITTTAVGAAYDLVYDGINGFVVQENNITELYEAMKKILDLDMKKMGLTSRNIFEEKNNFEKMADGFTHAINYVNLKK